MATISLGEPGNVYECYTRKALQDVAFEFDGFEPTKANAFIIHPFDIGSNMQLVFFTDSTLDDDFDHAAFQAEWEHATSNGRLENSARSTFVGVDVVVVPREAFSNGRVDYHFLRSALKIGEIKYKPCGNLDAGAMGSTAHRAWAMLRDGVVRRFLIITNDTAIAPMLIKPHERGLCETEQSLYEVIVVEAPEHVVELRNTIQTATLNIYHLKKLLTTLEKSSEPLIDEAQALVDFFVEHKEKVKVAAQACELSKQQRRVTALQQQVGGKRKAR